jgi:hypothetical protein
VKAEDVLPLMPMLKSLVFELLCPGGLHGHVHRSSCSKEVRYALSSTKSSATVEKAIASLLPVSSAIARGSLYLEKMLSDQIH